MKAERHLPSVEPETSVTEQASLSISRPKVFGLGMSKTGTKSLREALMFLGYTNHSWSASLLERWHAGDVAAVLAAAHAHDCVEDWPFLAVYEELMDCYGRSARYVLTVRKTTGQWLESVILHARRTSPEHDIHRRMAFGYDRPWEYSEEYRAFYENHNRSVRAAIRDRGLDGCFAELCWEDGDGWPGLCKLIGLPQPDRPFPHANRRPPAVTPPGSGQPASQP